MEHILIFMEYRLSYGGFSGGLVEKNPLANAEEADSVPGLRRFPRVGNGNLLQFSCLENPIVRGTWQTTVHGVTKSWTQLSNSAYLQTLLNSEVLILYLESKLYST